MFTAMPMPVVIIPMNIRADEQQDSQWDYFFFALFPANLVSCTGIIRKLC
jgi:hypothetical protein